jgi:acyl carrier protein
MNDGSSEKFPRTMIGSVSVSRMIIGTNQFLGFSHTSAARDKRLREVMTASSIADIIEVFLNEGIDTIMGLLNMPLVQQAVKEAQERTGRKVIVISTPTINVGDDADSMAATEKVFDLEASLGATVCMPHQMSTDALVDIRLRKIKNMDRYCQMIRERGMLPGLSTHMPETIAYADASGLDVDTYIAIYNAAGFLMHLEADWVHRIIWSAKHPVIAIKPMAAGRLLPLVGLGFCWATIRDIDMVAVGTATPDEAREVIEISRSILERTASQIELQKTRSKQTVASSP